MLKRVLLNQTKIIISITKLKKNRKDLFKNLDIEIKNSTINNGYSSEITVGLRNKHYNELKNTKCLISQILKRFGNEYKCGNHVPRSKVLCKPCAKWIKNVSKKYYVCNWKQCRNKCITDPEGTLLYYCRYHSCNDCTNVYNLGSYKKNSFYEMILCLKKLKVKISKDVLKIIWDITPTYVFESQNDERIHYGFNEKQKQMFIRDTTLPYWYNRFTSNYCLYSNLSSKNYKTISCAVYPCTNRVNNCIIKDKMPTYLCSEHKQKI